MVEGRASIYLFGGFFYAIGAVFYSTKFPERCKPGHFDICG